MRNVGQFSFDLLRWGRSDFVVMQVSIMNELEPTLNVLW